MREDELPDGWRETTMGEVADVVGGGTPKASDPANFSERGHPWITPADLSQFRGVYIERGSRDLSDQGLRSSSAKMVPTGTVLMSSRAPIGYLAIAANPVSTNQGFRSFICKPSILPGFAYYWLMYSRVTIEGMGSGSTFNEISGSRCKEIPLLYPPLAEQRRIVAKVEDLLASVNAARDRFARIPGILRRFRHSVLAAAVSGALTAEWRSAAGAGLPPWRANVVDVPLPDKYHRLSKQAFKITEIGHGAHNLPDTWCVLTIGDLYGLAVLVDFADGNHGSLYPRKEDFAADGATFLTATQIGETWELDLGACPRLRRDKAKQLTKGWARHDDVLLTHNATVGRVALIQDACEEILLGTSVTFYRFNPNYVLPHFARVVFSSQFFQDQLSSVMEQTTRDQVPITKQVSLNFLCPPLQEQREIVRQVEALLKHADVIAKRVAVVTPRAQTLTQAILSKAFRGELVPTDADGALDDRQVFGAPPDLGETCER